LDQNWLFGGKFNAEAMKPEFNDAAFEKAALPHYVSKLSWQGWHPAQWQDVWIYRRHFASRTEFQNRRVFLDFDDVMNTATPVTNDHTLPTHTGGYLPFSYEITNFLEGEKNVLSVAVDVRWNPVPPEGDPRGSTSVDCLEPGGIVWSVALRAVPQIFISDIFAKPVDVLNPFTLMDDSGGAGAVWIKSVPNGAGQIVVKATHSTLDEKSVAVNVHPAVSP
jgi:beta-galactosidase